MYVCICVYVFLRVQQGVFGMRLHNTTSQFANTNCCNELMQETITYLVPLQHLGMFARRMLDPVLEDTCQITINNEYLAK